MAETAGNMRPGDVVNIPANVKHWHGAAPDSWFSHLAVEVKGEDARQEIIETQNGRIQQASYMRPFHLYAASAA